MYSASMPASFRKLRIVLAMNSGPLSLRMCFGTPRVLNMLTKMSRKSSDVIERATSSATHSHVHSSTIVSQRSDRPRSSLSCTKSMHQTSFIPRALRRAMPFSLMPSRHFLRRFCGTPNPSHCQMLSKRAARPTLRTFELPLDVRHDRPPPRGGS